MNNTNLFGDSDEPLGREKARKVSPAGAPRLETAKRGQLQWGPVDLDARLPQDHRARVFWDLLGGLDLSRFYEWIKARGSVAGRPATDPKILLALWLLATSEGVGSANELAELCELHDAYRWICGGVSVCDHVLSDFRTQNTEELDDLITQVLAVLINQGELDLGRVAQDGMRVRASAGAASFRSDRSLEQCLEEARTYLEHVKKTASSPDSRWSRREAAAKERAARERLERVESALKQLPAVKEAKLKAAKRRGGETWKRAQQASSASPGPSPGPEGDTAPPVGDSPSSCAAAETTTGAKKDTLEARVSTTDPDARVMKMADGGFRPAFNFQFATDAKSRVVVGVFVINNGSDGGQMTPMIEDIYRRTGKIPKEYLIDGGFVKLDDIDRAEARGAVVYAPVPNPNNPRVDPYKPKSTDGDGAKAWRERMSTKEAKEIYKVRAATAERTNADVRVHRGLDRLSVRGLGKALSVGLLAVLTYDLLQPVVVAALRS